MTELEMTPSATDRPADPPLPRPIEAPLRIAQVVPPFESVPPRAYGGTERVVEALVDELVRRGHAVTTFASADSTVAGELVATVPRSLRLAGFVGDPTPYVAQTLLEVARHGGAFDVIHGHLDWANPLLASVVPGPVVATFHGRLDQAWSSDLLGRTRAALVAISASQAAAHPEVSWAAIIHNGLHLERAPFGRQAGQDLCFVGRVGPEKGVLEAIEVARLSGRRLRIAAKVGLWPADREYEERVFRPALGRADVEYLGEVTGPDRDRLMAESFATLVPAAWPEPFGLVVIESLACGTPVLAHRVGAIPEIVRDGTDGFLGDDAPHLAHLLERVAGLDRAAIRAGALERFSAARMADGYERLYAGLAEAAAVERGGGTVPRPGRRLRAVRG